MKRILAALAVLIACASAVRSEQTKTRLNPYTGKLDLITALSTTSVKAGSNVTVTTTSSGVQISASGSGGSGGGYAVEPATVAFQLNQGFSATTGYMSLTGNGPVLQVDLNVLPFTTNLPFVQLSQIGSPFAAWGGRADTTSGTVTKHTGPHILNGDGSVILGQFRSEAQGSYQRGAFYVGLSSGTSLMNVPGNALIGANVQGTVTVEPNGLTVQNTIISQKGVKAATFTASGLTSQNCIGTDSSGNFQAGTCGGGGSSSLEVFSNFDGTRTTPTASISIGDALNLTVSGSTSSINVDFSSVTALGATPTTSVISEGTNLYYTTARATTAVSAASQTYSGAPTFSSMTVLNGNLYFGGTLPRRRVTVSGPAGTCQTTNGCATATKYETATTSTTYMANTFTGGTTQYWQFNTTLPANYSGGTFTAFIEWSSTATTTGSTWSIDSKAVSDDDSLDGAWGTAVQVSDATTAAGDMMRTAESAAITAAGSPVPGDSIHFRLYRGDAGDARLIRFTFTFPVTKISTE